MSNPVLKRFMNFADGLKFTRLFILTCVLFVLNLFIPDFIPFLDEILLGLFAIILAKLKKQKQIEDQGNVIEGEVINKESKNS